MQQANLFTTNCSFQKTYKTQSFIQHERSGTPQKLIDVHLAEYKCKDKYKKQVAWLHTSNSSEPKIFEII